MQTLQVVLGDEVAELVRRAAEKEARSVSSWLRLLVERELAVTAAPRQKRERGEDRDLDIALGGDPACAHARVEKRSTSFGIQRFCQDCDRFMSA